LGDVENQEQIHLLGTLNTLRAELQTILYFKSKVQKGQKLVRHIKECGLKPRDRRKTLLLCKRQLPQFHSLKARARKPLL
jgi:uncharacterized protein YeeX (DUF496 family)